MRRFKLTITLPNDSKVTYEHVIQVERANDGSITVTVHGKGIIAGYASGEWQLFTMEEEE